MESDLAEARNDAMVCSSLMEGKELIFAILSWVEWSLDHPPSASAMCGWPLTKLRGFQIN